MTIGTVVVISTPSEDSGVTFPHPHNPIPKPMPLDEAAWGHIREKESDVQKEGNVAQHPMEHEDGGLPAGEKRREPPEPQDPAVKDSAVVKEGDGELGKKEEAVKEKEKDLKVTEEGKGGEGVKAIKEEHQKLEENIHELEERLKQVEDENKEMKERQNQIEKQQQDTSRVPPAKDGVKATDKLDPNTKQLPPLGGGQEEPRHVLDDKERAPQPDGAQPENLRRNPLAQGNVASDSPNTVSRAAEQPAAVVRDPSIQERAGEKGRIDSPRGRELVAVEHGDRPLVPAAAVGKEAAAAPPTELHAAKDQAAAAGQKAGVHPRQDDGLLQQQPPVQPADSINRVREGDKGGDALLQTSQESKDGGGGGGEAISKEIAIEGNIPMARVTTGPAAAAVREGGAAVGVGGAGDGGQERAARGVAETAQEGLKKTEGGDSMAAVQVDVGHKGTAVDKVQDSPHLNQTAGGNAPSAVAAQNPIPPDSNLNTVDQVRDTANKGGLMAQKSDAEDDSVRQGRELKATFS